jgi:hypothetical protein
MNSPKGQLRTTQIWLRFQNGHDPEVKPDLRVSEHILSNRRYCRRILNHIGSRQLPPYLTSSALVQKPVAIEQFSEAVRRIGTFWMCNQPSPGPLCGERGPASMKKMRTLSIAGQKFSKAISSDAKKPLGLERKP